MRLTTIRLDAVELNLGDPPVRLLYHEGMRLQQGIHCILGPNGAGKTLTNRILALVQEISHGSIYWNDIVINPFSSNRLEFIRKIGYMRQEPVFVKRTVRENILLPLEFRRLPEKAQESKLDDIVHKFQLDELLDQHITTLSTGQRQRVALARTLIIDPQLIILDEPTSAMDMKNTKWFEATIKQLQAEQPRIILWTTHDQFQARRVADTVSILIDGTIVDSGSVIKVLDEQSEPKLRDYLTGKLVEFD